MKMLMPIILVGTIPILWLAMRISDKMLTLPVIAGIAILGSAYCWLARKPEAPPADEISRVNISATASETAPPRSRDA